MNRLRNVEYFPQVNGDLLTLECLVLAVRHPCARAPGDAKRSVLACQESKSQEAKSKQLVQDSSTYTWPRDPREDFGKQSDGGSPALNSGCRSQGLSLNSVISDVTFNLCKYIKLHVVCYTGLETKTDDTVESPEFEAG